jgi:mono/diheme cytochrome c family protein
MDSDKLFISDKRTDPMIKICVAAGLIGLVVLSWSADKPPAFDAKVERGKYLSDKVALCGDCHTPHDEQGEPIQGKKLQGAVLAVEPTVPVPIWAAMAPGIAGLPRWSDADAIALLSTGETTKGIRVRPPMPAYRLTRQDAEAVVSYLRSLPAGADLRKASH